MTASDGQGDYPLFFLSALQLLMGFTSSKNAVLPSPSLPPYCGHHRTAEVQHGCAAASHCRVVAHGVAVHGVHVMLGGRPDEVAQLPGSVVGGKEVRQEGRKAGKRREGKDEGSREARGGRGSSRARTNRDTEARSQAGRLSGRQDGRYGQRKNNWVFEGTKGQDGGICEAAKEEDVPPKLTSDRFEKERICCCFRKGRILKRYS